MKNQTLKNILLTKYFRWLTNHRISFAHDMCSGPNLCVQELPLNGGVENLDPITPYLGPAYYWTLERITLPYPQGGYYSFRRNFSWTTYSCLAMFDHFPLLLWKADVLARRMGDNSKENLVHGWAGLFLGLSLDPTRNGREKSSLSPDLRRGP